MARRAERSFARLSWLSLAVAVGLIPWMDTSCSSDTQGDIPLASAGAEGGTSADAGAPADVASSLVDGALVDGAAGIDSAPPGSDGSAAPNCAPLANNAPTIKVTYVAKNAPAAAGGPLTDGTYFLVKVTGYTGPGGQTGTFYDNKSARELTNGATLGRLVYTNNGESGASTEKLTVSGTGLTFTSICGDAGAATVTSYDATPTSFSTHRVVSGITFVWQWDRQ